MLSQRTCLNLSVVNPLQSPWKIFALILSISPSNLKTNLDDEKDGERDDDRMIHNGEQAFYRVNALAKCQKFPRSRKIIKKIRRLGEGGSLRADRGALHKPLAPPQSGHVDICLDRSPLLLLLLFRGAFLTMLITIISPY